MKNQRCYRARTDIYNCMIWLHARHQWAERARSLFSEMQEWRSGNLLTFQAYGCFALGNSRMCMLHDFSFLQLSSTSWCLRICSICQNCAFCCLTSQINCSKEFCSGFSSYLLIFSFCASLGLSSVHYCLHEELSGHKL